MRCPSCKAENADVRKFCRACGAALAPVCPACGTRNDPGDRFCGECGGPLVPDASTARAAPPPQATPSGPGLPTTSPAPSEERRPVTVLFADLAGYTALSERLGSEAVRELTTECLRRLAAEVVRYGGTVDKLIGDCLMALFGAPVAHEDDPARAMRSALGMQRALAAFNEELAARGGPRLGLRIGVESGEVVAGPREVGGLREYTVIGDAVNVAARLQAATEPDSVLVGWSTALRAGPGFRFRQVPALRLRGKQQPVAAALLLGTAPGEQVDGQRTPLVGRSEELAALSACLRELRRGRGQVALVFGEPGLGKSRLLAELRWQAGGLTWVRGQAFAHEQDASYGLTRSLVRGLLGLNPDETEHLPPAQPARLPELPPILEHLLGLPGSQSAGMEADLAPSELQRRTFEAVAALVAARAEAGPLVLELDDLHWADPTSVDLLRELLDLAEQVPVCFLLAFRPDRDAPAWSLRERSARDLPHRSTEVLLRPLSESDSADLVARLLEADTLPDGLRALLERAAGTPLWVEELVRSLVERGLLRRSAAGWELSADPDQVEIPTSLQALIVSRIDRLGAARTTLQTAAVIGRRFGRRVLERVAGETAPAPTAEPLLDEHLRLAQRADLLRELAAIPEREYGFKHVLIQEAAYGTLLERRRKELHWRVAEALAQLYADRLEELHPLLAHHYVRAEAWELALEHATRAAETARAAYANREAISHYSLALESAQRLGRAPAERLSLYEARAEVYAVLGEFEAARADFEVALSLAKDSADDVARARLLGALGALWGGYRDYQRGLELVEQSAHLAARLGDRRAQAEARLRAGVMRLNLAQVDASRRELIAALEGFRSLNEASGQARVLDVLAMVSGLSAEFADMASYGCEAAERLAAQGDRLTEASACITAGLGLGFGGQRDAAELWIQRGLATFEAIGARGGVIYTRMAIAQVVEQYGAYGQAIREAEAALALAREVEHHEWTVGALGYLGRALRCCGEAASARPLHEEMLDRARRLGTALWTAFALSELGEDLAAAGDEEASERHLAEAEAAAGECRFFALYPIRARAELALRRGRPAETLAAADHFARLAPRARTLGADLAASRGQALAALGNPGAEAALRAARLEATNIGVRPAQWRSALALAELLIAQGRLAEAATERALALTALESVSAELTDDRLRQAFRESAPFDQAQGRLGP